MELDLPYSTEYAKSGRANCRGCKTPIDKETLRLAVMVQSFSHDSKQPNWFHEKCFFNKQRPMSVGDIKNFENIRFEDQERIRKQIETLSSASVISNVKGGKKRSKVEKAAMKDFGIIYAASGRAVCRGCEQKILKGEVRIRKTVYDTEVGMKYGGQPLWHHVQCFAQLRSELGWFETGEQLDGFKDLKASDKEEVKKALPAMKSEDTPQIKKPKLEKLDKEEVKDEEELQKKIEKQTKVLFGFRDNCKSLAKNDLTELLTYNKQEPVSGNSEGLLDQLADMLTFGAIAPCPNCSSTQILFSKSGYLCNGQLTEWTKCMNLVKEPKRSSCKIPKEFSKKYEFLKNYKIKANTRAIRYIAPSAITIAKNIPIKKDEVDGPKVKRERPPLYDLQFAHIGLKAEEAELKKRVMKLGGSIATSITEKVIAIFSTPEEVKSKSSRMKKAKELGIHIVPIDYLDSVEKNNSGAIRYISSVSLCNWGTDPNARIPKEDSKSMKSKSIYTKSVPKSIKLIVKDGTAVDPASELEDVSHVYVKNDTKYTAVLGLTDLQKNKNSYYKIQLLQSDSKNRYWVFRSWGRIGTTIGGNKLEKCSTLDEAVKTFCDLYADKSGNDFDNRKNFVKVPGKMYPIDIDYNEDIKVDFSKDNQTKSKLNERVQDLVKLIFDINIMKRTMMEFDLDMEKMPLGKLSQKQIQMAYKVLTEVYELIDKKSNQSMFIDATNRFYTLIPHNFGIENPPLLESLEQIEHHRQMLDSLLEIECAYNLLKVENENDDVNPFDKHYGQLKTELEPLDKNSEEFALLKKYVENTHAETHKMYELEIVDIFKVARNGESRRYKPFKKLHNRKLLWHGSRLTNYAGILSHGLKIAPPEAPVTGYMFGKGIYFADMVSKSANYCSTTPENNEGLMLLSEVALGDMMECTAAKYVTKLPKDKHSCFGRGRTMPDPSEAYNRKDGVEIPLGKPLTDSKMKSSLLYNEFIVYDIAQVNIQYLFRMKFQYKI